MEWFNKIKGVEWNFLFQRFSAVLTDKFVGIISNIFLARLTSPENFGMIILIYSVADVVFSVFDFGLGGSSSIEFSKNKLSKRKLLLSSVKYKFLSIPFVFFLSWMVSFFLNQQINVWIVFLIIFSEGLNTIIQLYFGLYYSNNDFKKLLLNTVISRSIQIILYIIVILLFPNYYLIFCAILLQYSLSLYLCHDYTVKLNLTENSDEFSLYKLMNEYRFLGINRIFNSFNSRVDNFVISQLLNLRELALYGVSMIFFRNFGLLSNSMATIYLPKYGMAMEKNNKREIFYESLIASFCVGLVSAIIVFFISGFAVKSLWGEDYIDSVILIKIFAVGIPFLFVRTTAGYFLNFLGKTKINLILSFFSFVVSILLNMILIPFYGLIISAAIAVLIPLINSIIMLYIISNLNTVLQISSIPDKGEK